MQRRELNLLLDWVLLAAALATFSTGLVLLLCLHAGDGASAAAALGVDRLIWVNVHRLSAALALAGVTTHVALHWRAFRSRLANVIARRTKRPVDSEAVLYATFLIAAFTGFVAWLALEGSTPLFGPAVIGPASGARHPWIDTHHLSSLVSLALIVHHVGHRWRLMVRRPGPASLGRKAAMREPV